MRYYIFLSRHQQEAALQLLDVLRIVGKFQRRIS